MFLKRRDLLAWVLLLTASVCWVFGVALANAPEAVDVLSNAGKEDLQETSSYWTEPNVLATTTVTYTGTGITASSVADGNRDTVETQFTEASAETNEGTYNTSGKYYLLKRVAGVMLCAGTGCMTIVSVFVLRQKKAALGPDGTCFVLGIWTLLCAVIKVDYGVLEFPGIRFAAVLLNVLFVFTVLFAVREIFCWISLRFSVGSCLIFRAAKRCRRPQSALIFTALWILAAFAGCMVPVYIRLDGGKMLIAPLVFWGAAAVLGGAGLWRYGADLDHFKKQLANYQSGLPIDVGDGAFSETEALLLEVRAGHEEAVRAAVTSERFKVELISNVSHDLRTPLTSILGYGELLEKEELSPEGREQLRRLNLKAGYMNELVDSLFELTKVSSGVILPKKEKIDLVCLLEQTVGFYDDKLSECGLVVRRKYEEETLPVITDGTRMHRVFSNLLGNAIKYAMPGTRIYIDVCTAGESYRIRILNTASYEMDFQSEEIVKRFVRGDKARTTKGSGLGLAIAKTYTESVGGSFCVSVDGDQFCAITELPKTVRDL